MNQLLRVSSLAVLISFSLTSVSPAADEGKGNNLSTLTLEQLTNIEVTSVSRKPEKSFQAAAAVYVITQEDIHRSGATSIPEALRLAPGVEVARLNSNQWAVSIRGANGFSPRLSRAVLVLVDGRAVYNPLFAGTYWESQDTLLEDIDHIEVVRGPGGAVWGANAVNGVINIITKSSKETHGGLITAGGGTEERGFGGMRYGGKINDNASYRVYGKYFDRDASWHADGNDFDAWHMGQSGFRSDWNPSSKDLVTLSGDISRGRAGQSGTTASYSNLFEANVLSRWTKTFSATSGFSLQFYYDRTDRRDPSFLEGRNTEDIDFQHRLALPGRQDILWGLGYRNSADETSGTGVSFFDPAARTLQTYSGFLQDTIAVVPDLFSMILGAKLENNEYTAWEFQPSVRFVVTPTEHQTIWSAISRAVRTPSRLERDLSFNGLISGADFESEKITAYEVGYRNEPIRWLSLDIAGFYNDYDDLLTVESRNPFLFRNAMKGNSEGVELAADAQVLSWWRLRGSYSFEEFDYWTQAGSTDMTSEPASEGSSPHHQVALHSLMNLSHRLELDPVIRYVSRLDARNTPEYAEMDVRVAWHPVERLELSLVGQNLLHDHHPEFTQVSELQRGMYGKVTWTW